MSAIAPLLDAARQRLAGPPPVAQDGLGQEKVSRWRGTRIVPVGRAWHLGVLLLTDDAVLATAEVLRSAAAVRRGYAAESARERAARREQARRGGFPEGAVVHVGWTPIDLDAVAAGAASGPLALLDGVPSVKWSRAGGYRPLGDYLDEQIELLGR